MFEWTFGTLQILFIGIFLSFLYVGYIISIFENTIIKKVTRLAFAALAIRLIWYLFYLAFIADTYPFMITDDYNYYHCAVAAQSALTKGRNNYQTLLNYIYYSFGATSLNGRLVNLIASVLCVYPIAYIDKEINRTHDNFIATKLYCFMPYMVTISSFEIKDILSMFFFVSSCMVMLYMDSHDTLKKLPSFLIFCTLSEVMRSGMGLLVLGVFACSKIYKKISGSNGNKGKRVIAFIIISGTFLAAVFVLMSTEYYQDTALLLGQYTDGRNASITKGSLFDFLTIKSVNDIWKVPLDLLFYIMLPNSSERAGRFMLDFGVYYRYFDVPVSILGVYWMIRNGRRFGFYVLCVIVPYVYLACIQIITFREVIFIVPLIYIFAVNYFFPAADIISAGSMKKIRIGNIRLTYRMSILAALYLVWAVFVMMRVG